MNGIISVLSTLVIVVLILLMSYFFSKYIAVGAVRLSGSKYIKIIDRIILGQDRSIVIIKVNKKYLMVGISSSGMNLLKELSPEDIAEIEDENFQTDKNTPSNFKDLFTSILSHKKK